MSLQYTVIAFTINLVSVNTARLWNQSFISFHVVPLYTGGVGLGQRFWGKIIDLIHCDS